MEGTGLYAYGFRYYDLASARFTGVDPIADQFAFVSGFNYAENSPTRHIDLYGLQAVDFNYTFEIVTRQTVPEWVPFGYRSVESRVLGGTFSNIKTDWDKPLSYTATFKVPARVSATSSGYLVNSYDVYNSSGSTLEEVFNSDNWIRQSNASRAFADGIIRGWMAAGFEGAAESLFAIAAGRIYNTLSRSSVDDKLKRYILNNKHPDGATKAKWFDQALGFNSRNADDLAKQIVFNPNKATKTGITQHGTKYNQKIPITGANGRTIDVNFGWIIRNNEGFPRLVTAIPTKPN